MCMCSQPVASVGQTNIFARAGSNNRQFLVYSMSLDAKKDLAMILPVPVKAPAGEDDVEFINLKEYPAFFVDLDRGFPAKHLSESFGNPSDVACAGLETLKVVSVGDFEASFVPTLQDFARLDSRFRLPASTWKHLPQYKSYGFAVFKLKPGATTIHPMAFSFLRRDVHSVFFPTVHVHDGRVHATARFDHALYCQPSDEGHPAVLNWQESYGHPGSFMQVEKTKNIILADQHCYKKEMRGRFRNRDVRLEINV
jgi:hypothetical protein